MDDTQTPPAPHAESERGEGSDPAAPPHTQDPRPHTPDPSRAPGLHRVELDAYAGPMDLLLHLVKRHEVDLADLPVAQLTEQYLEHVKVIQAMDDAFDVDRAGEFLVMAATLLEIKSQLLMPLAAQHSRDLNAAQNPDDAQPVSDDPAGDATDAIDLDATDPRYELVQQLLAYKRYKEAAVALERREHDWSRRFPAAPAGVPKAEAPDAAPRDLELGDVDILVLCEAFARVMDSVGSLKPTHDVTYDETPISLHADDIFDRLESDGPLSLQTIFLGRANRSEMIGLFLATLELVRQRKVAVRQDPDTQDVHLEARPEADHLSALGIDPADDEPPAWRDPDTGTVEYDWPDEESKRRAERRARLRAARADADDDNDADDLDDDDNE